MEKNVYSIAFILISCFILSMQACKKPSPVNPESSDLSLPAHTPEARIAPDEAQPDSSEAFVRVVPINCSTQPNRESLCPEGMVFVECGTFIMGAIPGRDEIRDPKGIVASSLDESGKFLKWEVPAHEVSLNDFCIGRSEVTQKEWAEIIGTTIQEHASAKTNRPLPRVREDYPMYYVNWYEADEYAQKFGEKNGKNCRLPSEAEWEYAARGGAHSNNYAYSGSNNKNTVGWYDANSGGLAQVPCQKGKNELGLCDMSGNMFEWVSDWYGQYTIEDKINPKGLGSGENKVMRGGGWHNFEYYGRNAFRGSYAPGSSDDFIGFRIVCDT
jgi:formylglycine-generating enzyme required for sulfatase activity